MPCRVHVGWSCLSLSHTQSDWHEASNRLNLLLNERPLQADLVRADWTFAIGQNVIAFAATKPELQGTCVIQAILLVALVNKAVENGGAQGVVIYAQHTISPRTN